MATVYTDAGEAAIVDLIDGVGSNVLSAANAKIGWGTGAGTAAKGDTTLFTESAETRASAAISQPAADKNRWVGTITSLGTQTITNAGLLDAASNGNLIIHGDFTGIVLNINDKIEFTITLEQT